MRRRPQVRPFPVASLCRIEKSDLELARASAHKS